MDRRGVRIPGPKDRENRTSGKGRMNKVRKQRKERHTVVYSLVFRESERVGTEDTGYYERW